uniref:Sulfotransferase n=1 Tax=Xenopus tropicalis TaxID=8364 RepID=A0A1B8XWY9_XENTR
MDPRTIQEVVKKTENSQVTMRHIEGVPLLGSTCDAWDSIYGFKARGDDILIATFPKAGTTWMQEIVDLILLEGDVEKSRRAPSFIKVPFLELIPLKPMPSGVSASSHYFQ